MTERIELAVADRVKFVGDRRWWDVKAVSDGFVALTRQRPFMPKGELFYTVIDWRNGVRGPCNLIGQGWGDGTYSSGQCAEMLVDFEKSEIEVSHRNRVFLGIDRIDRKEVPA